MAKKLLGDYITEPEAMALTGYKRTRLYQFRMTGLVKWTAAISGRKVRYHRGDLLKIMGL